MKCPKCGYENNEGAGYCNLCYEPLAGKERGSAGTPVSVHAKTEIQPVPAEKPRKSGITAALVRVAVYSLLALAALLAVKHTMKYRWSGYTSKISRDIFTVYSDLPEYKIRQYLGVCALFKDYFNSNVLPVRKGRIRIYLFGTSAAYIRYCSKINYHGSPYGFYSKDLKLLTVNHETGTGTMLHELTHFFMDAGGYLVPLWMEEGVATYFEKFVAFYENEDNRLLSVGYFSPWRFGETQLLRKKGLARFDKLPDYQSLDRAFMMYVAENGGISRFLRTYLKTRDDTEAVREFFGEDPRTVQQNWVQWIDAQHYNRNINFLEASRIFETRKAMETYMSARNAYWDSTRNLYRLDN